MTEENKFEFEIKDIPAMPIVATQVMQLVGDPNSSAKDITKVISADQALAIKVLQIANSPFFGCPKKISTITEAIVLMGMNALKSLVIATATKNLYKTTGLMENLMWDHSIGVSIASSLIARKTRSCPPEDAFIGGLLHDVGKTVINILKRDQYREVIKSIYNEDGYFAEKEQEILGYTHCDVGVAAIKKWQFSSQFEMVQRYHHAFHKEDERSDEDPGLLTTIIMANLICNNLGIGRRAPSEFYPLEDSYPMEYFNMSLEDVEKLREQVEQSFDQEKAIFQ